MAQQLADGTHASTGPITRAALQGYLVGLLGLLFVVENAGPALFAGGISPDLGGVVLGLFAIGGGVITALQPTRLPNGDEPASRILYALACLSTLAFLAAVVLTIT